MLSFLGAFKGIGKAVWSVALSYHRGDELTRSFINSTFPAAPMLDAVATRIMDAVDRVEAISAAQGKSGNGAEKGEAVIADFEDGLAMMRAVAAYKGKQLVYDSEAAKRARDAYVEFRNQTQALLKSVQEIDAPKEME